MKTKIAVFLLAAVALCGCHSDHYYHNEAINRARRYLLENTADLDSEQINYVRFNTPVLLHSKVLGGGVMRPGYVPMEMHQVCVTWIIPGKDDLYMVFGVSTGRMTDWSPNRIIKQSYRKSKAVLPDAAAPCVAYAQNNFFNRLEPNEISIVRFTAPYLYATDFDLNLNPTGKLSDEELAEAREKANAKRQYSLVWKLNRRNLVFSGLAAPGFVGWKSEMAGVLSDAELAPHLGKELMTPADYFKPFPVEKEPPAVKVVEAAKPVIKAKPAVKAAKPAAKAPDGKPAAEAAKPAAKPATKAPDGKPAAVAAKPAAKAPEGKPAAEAAKPAAKPAAKAPDGKPAAEAAKPAAKPAAKAPESKPTAEAAKPAAKAPESKPTAEAAKPAAKAPESKPEAEAVKSEPKAVEGEKKDQ